VYHPEKEFINRVTHVLFSAPADEAEADLKNAVVIPGGSVSRSPCGTGTSAKLAVLYAKGELDINEEFVHEGAMTNTIFKASVAEETKLGEFSAIIPKITGSAYVTGMHTYVVDPNDPLGEGFKID
jgi:proline racemase